MRMRRRCSARVSSISPFSAASSFLEASVPASIFMARLTSSWAVSRSTLPISFRYMRTGSPVSMTVELSVRRERALDERLRVLPLGVEERRISLAARASLRASASSSSSSSRSSSPSRSSSSSSSSRSSRSSASPMAEPPSSAFAMSTPFARMTSYMSESSSSSTSTSAMASWMSSSVMLLLEPDACFTSFWTMPSSSSDSCEEPSAVALLLATYFLSTQMR